MHAGMRGGFSAAVMLLPQHKEGMDGTDGSPEGPQSLRGLGNEMLTACLPSIAGHAPVMRRAPGLTSRWVSPPCTIEL